MDDKFVNEKISNSGYLFEKIDLTEFQIEKLEALQKLVTEADERGEKAMLLAQVFPSIEELSVGFLPHFEACRVLEIINPRGYQRAVRSGEIRAKSDNLFTRSEDAKFMTPEEWRGLSAESRHKINLFVMEYERMREALEWYADDKNYAYNVPGKKAPSSVWIGDMGERARMALKGGEG